MRCYFCKTTLPDSGNCEDCCQKNDLELVVTEGYNQDWSESVAFVNIGLRLNKFYMVQIYPNENTTFVTSGFDMKYKINSSDKKSVGFKKIMSLNTLSITPANVKEKLKTYLAFL